MKNCGFNALVTANNHNCDTGLEGLNATVQRIRNSGMANIGTLDDETHIADINGIKVGFVAVNSISNGLEIYHPKLSGNMSLNTSDSLLKRLRMKAQNI